MPDLESIRRLRREFQELSASAGGDVLHVTEKSPLNYHVLGLIHVCFPKARIVHCQRSPLDTCLSIYSTPFRQGIPFGHEKARIVKFYRYYLAFMAHWRSSLPPESLLEIEYEQLITNREETVRRMIEFCGLPWDDACLRPEENQRKVSTPSMWQVRQPVYNTSVEKWRRYEPWLGEFWQLAPEARDGAKAG
jgi:hypothetical protein